jgi:hypothetical protein
MASFRVPLEISLLHFRNFTWIIAILRATFLEIAIYAT